MIGTYVHIPFCKTRCAYCDFFSTTKEEQKAAYVEAAIAEMQERIHGEAIATIYLGGGTPSQLSTAQISQLLQTIRRLGHVSDDAEITMEANPGDLTADYLHELRAIGVNRLSIGIQSLQDDLLRTICRRHNADEAREAVRMAQAAGYDNLSIDLIYGLPGQTLEAWQQDIDEVLRMGVQHVSAYCLSYEAGTQLTLRRDKGEITETDEETELAMYDRLIDQLTANGYEHYEVSNFALPGRHSRHNSSYWCGTPYIGIGAGAHSYDGQRRSWWIGEIETYIHDALARDLRYESEELSESDQYNEQIMLSLRTSRGIDLMSVSIAQRQELLMSARPHLDMGLLVIQDGYMRATRDGIHLLNRIIEDLMI